ncbi:fumarylacetoacetate hydrolase family protein [Paenibacillus macquariensis]|uniref:2-keto-4-pentenoate hydratase/2-oxohepta-3-ene-1,7-dioic acid hydratase (Catechol pathway) n=1 Tax=Paenibacillus macquariensis TaxID=948756 RepID=A0ABY1JY62_9BACL|nr:fumarylacetoacetate hydrolase family protein [Paenibacillus macquariensis]MEC0089160.1 fumarylacetoacetate hydrolase family protein [Paenibacillus macquariensis]OAB33420.1 fumarylacetoacetate hydrolase [Paenibacillus macquariensis subsp. macquariensis]SIQ97451.1 2-keto-4-pentenoate hydratase/2-oxohepta-3-ene-1,7-dioic acid hydratase (catechol pathway) [Paenibacillus macquariensis]
MDSMIRNVYCVGRNYRLHAAELGNAVPQEPMIFMKPSHAVIPLDQSVITLPKDQGEVHYEGEIVILIHRDYEPGVTVNELVEVMALGIDFTLRDVQQVIKEKGHPWTAAKGFKSSAPLTPFVDFPGTEELNVQDFTVMKNKVEVQRGNASDMIFSLQNIVDYIGLHYGLGKGDLIFTGTPAGVGPVSQGDQFDLLWGDKQLGSCIIG